MFRRWRALRFAVVGVGGVDLALPDRSERLAARVDGERGGNHLPARVGVDKFQRGGHAFVAAALEVAAAAPVVEAGLACGIDEQTLDDTLAALRGG